jgi:hypothetical protein
MFQLKPSWIIFVVYNFFSSKLFFLGKNLDILRRKSIIHLKIIKTRVKMQEKTEKNDHFPIFELNEKGHEPSLDELKIVQLELRLEPAWLGL